MKKEEMEFYIIDKKTEEKVEEIKRRIRRLQSGGTIDSLRNIGANIKGQIGAGFVALKSLAAGYSPDEKLALLLWKQKRREEQIMACFLFPENMNREKITQLLPECFSFEISEYFGSIFLFSHPDLSGIAQNWRESPEPFIQVALLTAIARHQLVNKEGSHLAEKNFQELVQKNYTNRYVNLVAERYRFKFNKC